MTPEQKAKELTNSFYQPLGKLNCMVSNDEMWNYAVQCAIICVDEILKLIPQKKDWSKSTLLQMEAFGDNPNDFELPDNNEFVYWKSVLTYLTNI